MSENTSPRPSDANAITRRYLDSILIEERLIGAQTASLETEIFGTKFSTPVMMPAFMVSRVAFSSRSPKATSSGRSSSSPRFFRAPDQAKMVAVGFVEVVSPFRYR